MNNTIHYIILLILYCYIYNRYNSKNRIENYVSNIADNNSIKNLAGLARQLVQESTIIIPANVEFLNVLNIKGDCWFRNKAVFSTKNGDIIFGTDPTTKIPTIQTPTTELWSYGNSHQTPFNNNLVSPNSYGCILFNGNDKNTMAPGQSFPRGDYNLLHADVADYIFVYPGYSILIGTSHGTVGDTGIYYYTGKLQHLRSNLINRVNSLKVRFAYEVEARKKGGTTNAILFPPLSDFAKE
jgi:hypothetical protein